MNAASSQVVFHDTIAPDVVRLNKVSQIYRGGKVVIKDLDLLIEKSPKHQFAVILGPSGCGKSTVLRYIAGLQKPTSGEVLLNGKPLTGKDSVSMVFQQYSSPPWLTVLQNVIMPLLFRGVPKKEARADALEMIKAMGLEGHEGKYATTPILSGGQLQRVAIARSLVANQQVILMDEPFGALDLNTRLDMQLLIADIYERLQPTIIFVTHDIAEAVFLADVIFIMKANPGQIVKTIEIDLPLHRDRATKREHKFVELVYEVEDAMAGIH